MASDLSHVNDVRVEDIRSRQPPSSADGTLTRVSPNTDVNDLDSDNGFNSSRGTRLNSFSGDSLQQDQNEGFKEANGGSSALSTSLVPELAGASQILEKYQVEPFLKAMHKLQNGGKRSLFGKRAVTL